MSAVSRSGRTMAGGIMNKDSLTFCKTSLRLSSFCPPSFCQRLRFRLLLHTAIVLFLWPTAARAEPPKLATTGRFDLSADAKVETIDDGQARDGCCPRGEWEPVRPNVAQRLDLRHASRDGRQAGDHSAPRPRLYSGRISGDATHRGARHAGPRPARRAIPETAQLSRVRTTRPGLEVVVT